MTKLLGYITKFGTTAKIATFAAVSVLLLAGCFTGIESTPKITAKDVERQHATETPEARFARQLAPGAISQWQPGRRFLVTDERLGLLFDKEPQLVAGEVLEFVDVTGGVSFTGDSITFLDFRREGDEGGAELYRYRLNSPLSKSLTFTQFGLPMTVDLQLLETIRGTLCGNAYYVMTPLRVNTAATPVAAGRKFVKVRVVDVLPGNSVYPYCVAIAEEGANGAETADVEYVAMTVGADRSSTRNFDVIFSFTDPRTRYNAITDKAWSNIVAGRVVPGMTTEECRLALGAPRDVRKWQNGSQFYERWTFDNGTFLEFADGLLASYRL